MAEIDLDTIEAELIEQIEEQNNSMTAIVNNSINVPVEATDEELKEKAISEERRIRELEIAVWAENEKLLGGEPTQAVLKEVYERLKDGKTLVEALEGICGVTLWNQWRKDYPVVVAIEEQARMEYSNKLEQEILNIADQRERTRRGEVDRDKLMMDARQRIIDRNDRLTEARMKAQQGKNMPGTVVPVQINVKYGKQES
jgi:hypothetical protein